MRWDQILNNDQDINYISLFEALENAYEKVEMPLRLYRDSGHLSRFGNEAIYPYIKKAVMP